MYFVKAIVSKHKGEVTFQSDRAYGGVFMEIVICTFLNRAVLSKVVVIGHRDRNHVIDQVLGNLALKC